MSACDTNVNVVQLQYNMIYITQAIVKTYCLIIKQNQSRLKDAVEYFAVQPSLYLCPSKSQLMSEDFKGYVHTTFLSDW